MQVFDVDDLICWTIFLIEGFCPQHDILYDALTGREHLRLLADIKGVPLLQVKEKIDFLLERVLSICSK
jgi:ABC-type multidrug transport system ATPase subunit